MKENNKFQKSFELYKQAQQLFPYGTQLFSRRPELGPFGQAPIYFGKAKDGHFWDVDGNEFIDTALAFGPISLGYCYDVVDNAVKKQIDKGILGSINNPLEIEMANVIKQMIPCGEMVKFCKGGGEADAVAVRIARGFTGKDIVLFCGYHGWQDWYLAANLTSESNLNQHLRPGISAKGVPTQLAGTCIPFEYNNIDNLKQMLEQNKNKVACIIMEPTRFKKPEKGYLENVRQLADEHKCVLIFDEVVTGFRLAPGGAQEYFGVVPDLATYAKAIANGYALSVVAGKREIMSSQEDNFISSTYWSDTTTLAAGIATLNEIRTKPVIATIDRIGHHLITGLEELGRKHQVNIKISGHGCDFAVSFDYGNDAGKILTLYMQEMIARGIYVSGVVYTCFTHTDKDIDIVLAAADETFEIIKKAIDGNNVDIMLKCPVRQVGFKRLV
ncbi:MAG: hypothetical protein A2Y10_00415 [Planctomycetes bacterium GWF2_41_51]|nr:MAG: hypothetical protein A2Y10_00415 [Planctomycetes bacterium GWF2_41_51]HBG26089.1 hypothetical protein [Phycisphaerales bacterium]